MKLFKNKETKKKTTRRRKKKTFFQEHPFISYTMIFIAILAGLNYAMLTPPLIASIFYEIEHTVIRLLILPIPLQRWELILITLVTAMIGYFVFPTVWSPSENLSLTYRKVRYGEGLAYFTTFFGEEHGFPEELVEKAEEQICPYYISGKIEPLQEGTYIIKVIFVDKYMDKTEALHEMMSSYCQLSMVRFINQHIGLV